MNADDLEQEFKSRGVREGGSLLLLAAHDAVALVRRAAHAGVPILGVEVMFVSESGTGSPIDHIADYSAAVDRGDGCWSSAEAFIEEHRTTGMVFEVVLGKLRDPEA
jgi:hypothetical protein